jgi:hypothetical protein
LERIQARFRANGYGRDRNAWAACQCCNRDGDKVVIPHRLRPWRAAAVTEYLGNAKSINNFALIGWRALAHKR